MYIVAAGISPQRIPPVMIEVHGTEGVALAGLLGAVKVEGRPISGWIKTK